MTANDFFTKYNGKGINFDGYYGNQCMDLYQQYNKEVVGAPSVPANPAYKVWYYNLYPLDFYTKIANTPDGVPQAGDVVIWGPNLNGGFGHISVFQKGDVNNFTSFDQNFPSQGYYDYQGNFIGTGVCHFQPHNYNYVYGWLRPKNVAPTPITDGQKLQKVRDIVNDPANPVNSTVTKVREAVS